MQETTTLGDKIQRENAHKIRIEVDRVNDRGFGAPTAPLGLLAPAALRGSIGSKEMNRSHRIKIMPCLHFVGSFAVNKKTEALIIKKNSQRPSGISFGRIQIAAPRDLAIGLILVWKFLMEILYFHVDRSLKNEKSRTKKHKDFFDEKSTHSTQAF